MTRGGLRWPSSTSRQETSWPKRGRNLRKAANRQPAGTPVDPLSVCVRRPLLRVDFAGQRLAAAVILLSAASREGYQQYPPPLAGERRAEAGRMPALRLVKQIGRASC